MNQIINKILIKLKEKYLKQFNHSTINGVNKYQDSTMKMNERI